MTAFQHMPKTSNLKFAVRRVLDAVWVLVYEPISDDKIEIIYYVDMAAFGTRIESLVPACRVIEDDRRFVRSVQVSDRVFQVANPRYVFSYVPDIDSRDLSSLLMAAMQL